MSVSILESRKERERDIAASKIEAWRQLVSDACNEIARDPSDVDLILSESGRTAADLEKAIAHFQDRLKWKADLAAGEVAAKEFEILGQQ